MPGGRVGIVQEAKSDPAGGKLLFGLVDIARGECRVAGDEISGAVLSDVNHLAREQPPLDPPLIDIIKPVGIPGRALHQPRGFRELLFAAQELDIGEDIAGIAVKLTRHSFDQRAQAGRSSVGSNPRLGKGLVRSPEPLGRAHSGIAVLAVKHVIHARFVVARRDQRPEHLQRFPLDRCRHRIGPPGLADQLFGAGAVSAREQRACESEPSLGRLRPLVFEPGQHGGGVAMVVPQRSFRATAQECLGGPTRIGVDEGAIALGRRAVIVTAQDKPLGELASHRISQARLDLRRLGRPLPAGQVDDRVERREISARGR